MSNFVEASRRHFRTEASSKSGIALIYRDIKGLLENSYGSDTVAALVISISYVVIITLLTFCLNKT